MNRPVLDSSLDSFRALEDAEIRAAVHRIIGDWEALRGLGKYWLGTLGGLPPARWLLSAWLRYQARNIHSINTLHRALNPPISHLVNRHIQELEIVGLDELVADPRPWLFVSNHRDIMLDSLLINLKLHESGHECARVAIGDNLLQLPDWGSLILRSVGCFMVKRASGSRREQYRSHQQLSGYIRYLLTEAKLPVWLAQRSGRSLDGVDTTDPTVLKMLHLCDRKTPFRDFMAPLCVVPVTLSYEYDPCDQFKAKRLVAEAQGRVWKSDYAAEAQVGLLGEKGRVRLQIGTPLSGENWHSAEDMANDLDRHIQRGYHLWPTAFAAASELGIQVQEDISCSQGELQKARQYLRARCRDLEADAARLLLQYYAKPLLPS